MATRNVEEGDTVISEESADMLLHPRCAFVKEVFIRAVYFALGLTSFILLWVNIELHAGYLGLILPLLLLLLEGIFVLCIGKGKQFKYLWLLGLLFIANIVPIIWIFMLTPPIEKVQGKQVNRQSTPKNATLEPSSRYSLYMRNSFNMKTWRQTTEFVLLGGLIVGRVMTFMVFKINKMFVVKIFCYLGNAADILCLLPSFLAIDITYDLRVLVLCLYTLALLQFTLITDDITKTTKGKIEWLMKPGILQLFATVVIHDGPFFALRVFFLTTYGNFSDIAYSKDSTLGENHSHVTDQVNLFFTIKNFLVCLTLTYKLASIAVREYRKKSTVAEIDIGRPNMGTTCDEITVCEKTVSNEVDAESKKNTDVIDIYIDDNIDAIVAVSTLDLTETK